MVAESSDLSHPFLIHSVSETVEVHKMRNMRQRSFEPLTNMIAAINFPVVEVKWAFYFAEYFGILCSSVFTST